jgi:hypothetical protein
MLHVLAHYKIAIIKHYDTKGKLYLFYFLSSFCIFASKSEIVFNDMICLLSAIGLTPGGSSTVHIYTQTVHRTTINLGRVRAVLCVCELYPVICLTAEEKTRENLSQGSRRVPFGAIKTEYIRTSNHFVAKGHISYFGPFRGPQWHNNTKWYT